MENEDRRVTLFFDDDGFVVNPEDKTNDRPVVFSCECSIMAPIEQLYGMSVEEIICEPGITNGKHIT